MKPIKFPEANTIFAEEQKEYLSLPAFRSKEGEVVTCWQITFKEWIKLFFSQKIWITVLTFNKPLQPIALNVDCPLEVK